MIDAKVSFLSQLKQKMSDALTLDQIDRLMKESTGLLDMFEMRELQSSDNMADDLLDSYVAAMKVECRSDKTIDRYVYVIGKLMEFAKVPTRRISVYHLRAYLAAQKERGIMDSTLEGHRQIFSAYFNWLQRENLIENNKRGQTGQCRRREEKEEALLDADGTCRCRSVQFRPRATFEEVKT